MAKPDLLIAHLMAKAQMSATPSGYKVRYRYKNKIVMTHNPVEDRFSLAFDRAVQEKYHKHFGDYLHPVPNKFGEAGYTLAYYKHLPKKLLMQMIDDAYALACVEKLVIKKAKSIRIRSAHALYIKVAMIKHIFYAEILNSEVSRYIQINYNGQKLTCKKPSYQQMKPTQQIISADLFELLQQRDW
jgi:hypothetical protein